MYAIIVGLVITVITGIINTTPHGLLGAMWYGFPVAWRFVLVTLPPVTHYKVINFIGDWIFWFVLVAVVMMLWEKMKA